MPTALPHQHETGFSPDSADADGGDAATPSPAITIPAQPAVQAAISANGMDHFHRLQRRLIVATAMASALAVPSTALLFDAATAMNLLVGALAGLLYLRLLARSVARLGPGQRSVGKLQLLVPIVLTLVASRIPQLHILPCLIGFLLYKPALIVQAILAP